MTDESPSRTILHLPAAFDGPRGAWRDFARWVGNKMPKGLYARSLLIVILPMVLLQSVVAYFFMERYWQLVTVRLSTTVVQDVAAIIEIHDAYPKDAASEKLQKIAADKLNLDVEFLPLQSLPPPLPKPFFSILG